MIQFGDEQTKLNLQFEEELTAQPGANIKVIGVGGAGGNAVDRMIEAGVTGVDFLVANTDSQALRLAKAPVKIHIGAKVTKGLGAGAKPEIGREAALEDTNVILEHLDGADMVFVTAGLGGGTGTGAAPIIASLASELGALVVAVVTSPFRFEGPRRRRNAEHGLSELKGSVDTVITISNDKLLATVPADTPFKEAFGIADDVLRQAVQGISDLINVPGVINLDFADVKTIMQGMGVALMGSGSAAGDNRAIEAAQLAISSPLLEEANINGARGVLLNIVGGSDLTMMEINEAASLIHEACDPDAEIIFGAVTDDKHTGDVTVTVIATGFSTPSRELPVGDRDVNVVEYVPQESKRGVDPMVTRRMKSDSYPSQKVSVLPRGQSSGRPPVQQPSPARGRRAPSTDIGAPKPKPTQRTGSTSASPSGRMADRDAFSQDFRSRQSAKRNPPQEEQYTEILDEEPQFLEPEPAPEFVTPEETIQEVLMTPQNYGANNLGFDDENDLDIPTYLRNRRKIKK